MTIEASFQTALEQHHAGNLDEAERIYREILQGEPGNAYVLHFLGILLFQKKDIDTALEMIKKSIEIDPGYEDAYYNLAGILQDIGQFDEAISYYRKVIEINPDLADTYNSLGAVLQKKGLIDDAIAHYRKAIEINPNLAIPQLNLGYALQQKGQLDEAIDCYRKAVEIKPDFDDAYYNLGVVYQTLGQFDDALVNYYKAMHHNLETADVHNNIGIILKIKGQHEAAAASFKNALEINPGLAEVWSNLGNALYDTNDFGGAVEAYQKSLELNPDMYQTYYDLGNALKEEGRTDEAMSAYEKTLSLKPDFFKARWAHCMTRLPVIYPDKPAIKRARDSYREELLKLQRDLRLETPEDIDAAVEAVGSHQPLNLAAQGLDDSELQKMHGDLVCRIMSAKYPQLASRPVMSGVLSDGPIRIGIVSGHFYDHANWRHLIKGWAENIDRKRFSLYGYYTGIVKDGETEAARSGFSRFVEDIVSFEKLTETIRNDNLHILIFPEIGMDALTLRLASLRLAPVQCASWGHPDTSGLPTIDYYLSSALMEPPGGEEHYTERLIRLPGLSIHYVPSEIAKAEATRATFGLRPKSVIYLCNNGHFTHLPQYDDIYPRIARQTGDCQFVFIAHNSKSVTGQFRRRIGKVFEQSDLIADDHLVFLPMLDPSWYRALNSLADVFLDIIEWSNIDSAFEAVACDLPVVTFPGKFMRGMQCSAILQMMGLTETIAHTLDEYIELAGRVGKNSGLRHSISEKIAANKHRIYRDMTCISALEDFFGKVVREKL